MPEVDTLIVDSAPIIKDALSLNSISSKIMTVPEVFKELRDAKTRLVLQTLPFDIAQKTPAEVYVSRIIQFSKKTGDFASLSMPDIKVLALTLQMHTEIVGDQYLRKEPVNPMILSVGSQVDDLRTNAKPKETLSTVETPDASLISENLTQELKSMSISSPLKKNECPSDFSQSSLDAVTVAPSEVVDDDASDDEGWITPEILAKEKQQKTDSGKAKIISVACMTDDFAMQNVLLQMKLPLISTDGMRIKRLKSWLLRCHACFKTTKILSKQFCPSCGNSTLIRTSVSIDRNGKMTMYLKKNFQYNLRGTQFNIPGVKGGRKGNDMILREDQREYERAVKLKERMDRKALSYDMDAVDFGRAIAGGGKPVVGYGRKNINQAKHNKRR